MVLENISSCYDAEQAETIAILKALEFAKDFELAHFVIEGDALSVTNKIYSGKTDLSMTGHLIEGIRNMMKDFPELKIVHTKGCCNAASHDSAKLALHVKGKHVWFTNFPLNVLQTVKCDVD